MEVYLRLFAVSAILSLQGIDSLAQEIPLFTQKITNSFLYNPAVAGDAFGSMTYSYRKNFSGVSGAPESNFLSAHAPFSNYRFGTGFNLFQEDVNFIRSNFLSAAFAYHLYFDKYNALSAGLSAEYTSFNLKGDLNFISSQEDPILIALRSGNQDHMDFSAGIHYQSRFFKMGVSANRLSANWQRESRNIFSQYYSAYIQGILTLRNGSDIIEPYFSFRKMTILSNIFDAGLYYTCNDLITLGVGHRTGRATSFTLAFRILNQFVVGYTYEAYSGNYNNFLGASNEIVLRYDFIPKSNRHLAVVPRYTIPLKYVRAKNPKEFHKKNDWYVKRADRFFFTNDINDKGRSIRKNKLRKK